MELRRVRKLTPKKRCLDDISNSEKVDPNEPSSKVTKTSSNSNKKNKSKEDDNNTMTLEQFTDIVLASEGLAVEEKAKVKKEMEEENNNSKSKTESVVANLMQNNNDLIVEVKPTKAKPVVLSPRQQPGSHIMHRHAKVSLIEFVNLPQVIYKRRRKVISKYCKTKEFHSHWLKDLIKSAGN